MDQKLGEVQKLIIRFILGELPPDEQQVLDKWRNERAAHEVLFQKTCDRQKAVRHMLEYERIDVDKALLRNHNLLRKARFRCMMRKALPYAALIVVTLWGIYSWAEHQKLKQPSSVAQAMIPGACRAELILANGECVLLNAGVDTRIREGESDIRINGNCVNYFSDSLASALVYNTICTPLGGEYSVILSDGTKVWLNAMSELRYPVNFQGNDRWVELKGEAYFEVKKDADHPFYVTTTDYQVKVLGTSFNISAYSDQSAIQTTLCTGKVDIQYPRMKQAVILSPGEQANWNRRTGQMEVKNVDADLYIAWTRGEFRFDNTPIEEIFNILQRWYKIDIFYANAQVREEIFSGKLPRFDNLQVILKIMEKVSDVKFEMQGNTLIVK